MRFSVILENTQAVYYTGQSVKGIVLLELESELKIRAITVRLRGFADVFFAETQSGGSGSNPRTHTSHERYLDEKIYLFGKAEQAQMDNTVLPEGKYRFPFNYVLPKTLPSSYESQIGYIRYLIHATLERPWAFDKHDKKFFSVIEVLDLNKIPNMESGTRTTEKKTFCCLCCQSDPISASLSIRRRGYVPGETIVFDVKINNRSSRTIKESRASLIMQVLYHTSSRSTESNHVLAKTRHGQIDGPGQDVWKHERFKIPAVPPSYLKYCDIIDIQYFVELKIVPKGPGTPFRIQREIIVGTVPLKSKGFSGSRGSTPTLKPHGLNEYDSARVMFAESALGRVYNKQMLDRRDVSYDIDFVPLYGYFVSDRRDTSSVFMVSKQTFL